MRLARELQRRQEGVVLIALLALFGLIFIGVLLTTTRSSADTTRRDRMTAVALAQARDALIARAVNDANRPGSLPCPDTNNDGSAETFAGTVCPGNVYLGRLPWKTLDLPDLRDGNGERLWYALSPRFRDHPAAGAINSDTTGQLVVTSGPIAATAIAVVFSVGVPLADQYRDSANENTASNYLEGANPSGGTTNAYQAGPLSSTFNDQALLITQDLLMPPVEQRVARQALNCLYRFSQQPQAAGRFPWPAVDLTYADNAVGQLFGRIPSDLSNTNTSLAASPSLGWTSDAPLPATAPSLCFASGTWWDSWRELLFYSVSDAFKPTTGALGTCPASCLYVNGKGSVKLVVIVAGRATQPAPPAGAVQFRPSTSTEDYLEVEPVTSINNAAGSSSFAQANPKYSNAANFNDHVVCLSTTPSNPCP